MMRGVLCFAVAFVLLVLAGAQQEQTQVQKTTAKATSPASGQEMFLAYGASCHGKDAKGNGPAGSVLKIAPADLTGLTRKYGTYPAMKVTTVLTSQANLAAHGNSEMPVWGPIFSRMSQGRESEVQQRIANLNHYIESLQTK